MISLSYLYVIAPEDSLAGPVKLGISVNPDKRLKQLQTGHEKPLKIFYLEEVEKDKASSYERLLHKMLSTKRIRGEWFDISVDDAILDLKYIIIRFDEAVTKKILKFPNLAPCNKSD